MNRALLVVGLNHERAPLDVRERLAIPGAGLPAALTQLLTETGLSEVLLLATCNRVEIWGVEREAGASTAVARWLGAHGGTMPEALGELLYERRGAGAVAHMASVAAGLDSMVIGEPQILGQVKAAHAIAAAHGGVGALLGEAVSQALRIARHVRTETEIGHGAVSVSYAAVELARRIFADLRDRRVVLVGAGEMGGLAARHLAAVGVSQLVIVNRTLDRAEAIARETGGKAVPFEEFPRHAAGADILICAATAPGVLITASQVAAWVAARPRPLFVIDLGVPRNVERRVARLADVYLYDVDDLEGIVAANRQARGRELDRARQLVAHAVAALERAAAARIATPTIRSLRAKVEEIRRAEVERALARLGDRSPRVGAAVDAMSIALVNKILHGPTEQLKAAQAAPGGARVRALVRELFGLEPERGESCDDGDDGEEEASP